MFCFLQALTHLWKWACPEAPLTQPMGMSWNRCWLPVRRHQGRDRRWSYCRAPRTPIYSMSDYREHLQLGVLLFSIFSTKLHLFESNQAYILCILVSQNQDHMHPEMNQHAGCSNQETCVKHFSEFRLQM